MLKYLYWLPLVFLLGCATRTAYTPANQKWLNTAQRMVEVNHDPYVSTPDPDRARLFINWAKKQGYKVKVSNRDPVKGFDPGMIFIVVSK